MVGGGCGEGSPGRLEGRGEKGGEMDPKWFQKGIGGGKKGVASHNKVGVRGMG